MVTGILVVGQNLTETRRSGEDTGFLVQQFQRKRVGGGENLVLTTKKHNGACHILGENLSYNTVRKRHEGCRAQDVKPSKTHATIYPEVQSRWSCVDPISPQRLKVKQNSIDHFL